MPVFQAPNGDTFRLDDPSQVDSLPQGSKEISEVELAGILASRAVDPSGVVPRVVTMRQARLALLQQGLLGSVETAMQSAGQAAQIEWEYAQGVEMGSPLVEAMRDALGLTDDDVLGLFAIAGGL